MKSAYLYVRVSTDEQKRKGYSLPEQEDRLLKYCDYNDIEVKGIYREDFSAKNLTDPSGRNLYRRLRRSGPKKKRISCLSNGTGLVATFSMPMR
jgi:DNA invertase Pin-like site-specific DNA recombinase